MKAIADVAALIPDYKSNCERRFADLGPTLLGAHFGRRVVRMDYESCSRKVPGGRYTPDFEAWLEDGTTVYVEVKGSKRQKGYRDSRSKLRAAAEVYPMFTWIQVVESEGWTVEVIGG